MMDGEILENTTLNQQHQKKTPTKHRKLRESAAGLMVLANFRHQEWVFACVTAGTHISVYFLISGVRKCASEHELALIKA